MEIKVGILVPDYYLHPIAQFFPLENHTWVTILGLYYFFSNQAMPILKPTYFQNKLGAIFWLWLVQEDGMFENKPGGFGLLHKDSDWQETSP